MEFKRYCLTDDLIRSLTGPSRAVENANNAMVDVLPGSMDSNVAGLYSNQRRTPLLQVLYSIRIERALMENWSLSCFSGDSSA